MMEPHDDPLMRDRKQLEHAGWSVLPPFLASVFLGIPLWLTVLLPLTALWNCVSRLGQCCCSYGKTNKAKSSSTRQQEVVSADSTAPPIDERRYDLVLFGATGFTGKLAASYLAKKYRDGVQAKFKWAIAGRRQDALENLRTELTLVSADLKNVGIIVADSNHFDSILAMVRQAKVVITTAGPFARYGTPIVKACAMTGTHYCDITGESDWVRRMIDEYDDLAKKTGARIVNFCGHDCVPWDLCVLMIGKALHQRGETLKEVVSYDEIRGNYSGGTMETMTLSLDSREKYVAKLGFDPLLKTPQGKASSCRTVAANPTRMRYADEISRWTGPFIMAMVMANCVRRSNAINQYGPRVTYKESVVYPGFMAGVVSNVKLLLFGTSLLFPPAKYIMRKYILPKPGEGPSEKEMDASFLKITVVGVGNEGTKVKTMMYFPTDPGYRDTARMLVESGLSLVFASGKEKIATGGGVWTPAACQGEILLRRLEATGTSFTISVLP